MLQASVEENPTAVSPTIDLTGDPASSVPVQQSPGSLPQPAAKHSEAEHITAEHSAVEHRSAAQNGAGTSTAAKPPGSAKPSAFAKLMASAKDKPAAAPPAKAAGKASASKGAWFGASDLVNMAKDPNRCAVVAAHSCFCLIWCAGISIRMSALSRAGSIIHSLPANCMAADMQYCSSLPVVNA